MPDLSTMSEWFDLFLKIGVPLILVIVAFVQKDAKAFEKLQALIPEIWNVVQQKLRKDGKLPDNMTPLDYGVHLTQVALGKKLSPSKIVLTRMLLQAHHEKMGAPDPQTRAA